MDETITAQNADDTGATALPDNDAGQAADISQDHAQANADAQGEQSSLPDGMDEKLAKFAESHGLELDSPNAVKAAKMAMDNQASYQQAQQKASQLDKSLQAPQQSDEFKEFISDYKRDKMLNQFKDSTPDWREHEPTMVEKLAETVNTPYGVYTRSDLVNAGILTLHDVYAMARGSAPQQKSEDVQQVLRSIANKQLAGANTPNAIKSTPSGAPDPILEAIKRAREA
jgi:hypothetical protein